VAGPDLPTFPEFTLQRRFWVTSANLPAWSGYQVRGGPYGSVSANGRSDGTVKLQFAPEGRDAAPLKEHEIELMRWVIDNQAAVHDAMLERLFAEYPGIREQFKGFFGKEERKRVLPKIRFLEKLKELVGVHCIHVHPIAKDGKPFIGVELGCAWDAEHGLGVLLHGAKALEVGGADTAITLWMAKKTRGNSEGEPVHAQKKVPYQHSNTGHHRKL
jgi:hypothetical protein